jgi:1-acyl-sn-glycerol-3-phosphate acyltransferase
MAQLRVSYAPPTGYPLGTNRSFKVGAAILIPIIRLITKRTWIGGENIPKSGAVIVANNHLSYFDVLNFAHFLFKNGRAPRFLGKVGVFRVPLIGRFLLAAGQVPVERETPNAGKAVDHAKKLLESGHLLGVYPEGTLSRDLDHWPMVAKTGLARLALTTNTPVIPVAQWGAQILMPTYSKKIKLFPRTQITIVAGKPVDLSPWYGKGEDQQALIEATAKIMQEITTLLEGIRGEKRPEVIFDPHTSDLPRIGNFKKKKR